MSSDLKTEDFIVELFKERVKELEFANSELEKKIKIKEGENSQFAHRIKMIQEKTKKNQ